MIENAIKRKHSADYNQTTMIKNHVQDLTHLLGSLGILSVTVADGHDNLPLRRPLLHGVQQLVMLDSIVHDHILPGAPHVRHGLLANQSRILLLLGAHLAAQPVLGINLHRDPRRLVGGLRLGEVGLEVAQSVVRFQLLEVLRRAGEIATRNPESEDCGNWDPG